jgi:hypothetical protein
MSLERRQEFGSQEGIAGTGHPVPLALSQIVQTVNDAGAHGP